MPREEWIEIPVPALVDPAIFEAAQAQLDENRRRRRELRRRPGWLLQGLVVCQRCGYAFYGKMARGRVGGRLPADYGYYRCTGTDAHRFGKRRRGGKAGQRQRENHRAEVEARRKAAYPLLRRDWFGEAAVRVALRASARHWRIEQIFGHAEHDEEADDG